MGREQMPEISPDRGLGNVRASLSLQHQQRSRIPCVSHVKFEWTMDKRQCVLYVTVVAPGFSTRNQQGMLDHSQSIGEVMPYGATTEFRGGAANGPIVE